MTNLILNTVLFPDDQVNVTSAEDDMQRVICALNNVAIKYSLISLNKVREWP
jgi:hypothetical protein